MQRFKYKLWRGINMPSMTQRLWDNFRTEWANFEETNGEHDDYLSPTEFLINFLDYQFTYTSHQIRTIAELLDSTFVDLEECNESILQSETVGALAYHLAQFYITNRLAHEEQRRQFQQEINEVEKVEEEPRVIRTDRAIAQREKEKYLYADFVDEDDTEP